MMMSEKTESTKSDVRGNESRFAVAFQKRERRNPKHERERVSQKIPGYPEYRKVEASGKRRQKRDLVILRERIEPEVDSDSKIPEDQSSRSSR